MIFSYSVDSKSTDAWRPHCPINYLTTLVFFDDNQGHVLPPIC